MGALLAGACLLSLGLLTDPSWSADKKARPLSRENVAQVWIGISQDELYVLRLALDTGSNASGAYVFDDEAPKVFRIASWNYESQRIELIIASADQEAVSIKTLEGAVVGTSMNLTVRGPGWSRKFSLRREGDLEPRWQRLKSAMASFERQTNTP